MCDKVFPCSTDGCTMAFGNMDHLIVHKKKHDMVLDLSVVKNTMFADETPTPTRFIRNCEEVGLFQDLQNVNPFDETFKKALENSKTDSLHIAELNSDDTLHTPHILPHIQPFTSKSITLNENSDFQEKLVIEDNVIKENSEKNKIVLNTKEIVITKLKTVLSKPKIKEKSEIVISSPNKKKIRLENEENGDDGVQRMTTKKSSVDIRREMNRMAQMRSRQKKKLQSQEYEKQMNSLKMENNMLHMENSRLKIELGKLQMLLLKFKSCTCKNIDKDVLSNLQLQTSPIQMINIPVKSPEIIPPRIAPKLIDKS